MREEPLQPTPEVPVEGPGPAEERTAPWPGWLGPAALGVMTAVAAIPVAIIVAVKFAGDMPQGDIDPASLLPTVTLLSWQLVGNVICLGFVWWYLRKRVPTARVQLGRGRPGWLLRAPLPTALVCLAANLAYSGLVLLWTGEVPGFMLGEFMAKLSAPVDIAVAGVLVLVVAPLTEEVVFRLLIYGSLRDRLPTGAAIWLSAFIFGAYHLDPAAFIPVTFLGLAAAWVYQRSGSLAVAVATHAVFNVFGFLGIFLLKV